MGNFQFLVRLIALGESDYDEQAEEGQYAEGKPKAAPAADPVVVAHDDYEYRADLRILSKEFCGVAYPGCSTALQSPRSRFTVLEPRN